MNQGKHIGVLLAGSTFVTWSLGLTQTCGVHAARVHAVIEAKVGHNNTKSFWKSLN